MPTPWLHIVILAAGQGKRMFSSVPKVLQPIAARPMLAHVIDAAQELEPAQIVVVYGHGGEQVQTAFAGNASLDWAHQAEQLGTGHALRCALPQLKTKGSGSYTLVLYGDVPLIQGATLASMLAMVANEATEKLVLLTNTLTSPTGYGRIIRDAHGQVTAIVEEKDATDNQKTIQEINTGILLIPNHSLEKWLKQLSNQNAQGEYYLTDIIALAVADGVPIATHQPSTPDETEGANNKTQLAALERAYQARQAQQLLTQGVTLLDPARIDIRGKLSCAHEVSIDVNCVFIGEVQLGTGVTIEPNCVIKDSVIGDQTHIAAFSHIDGATIGQGVHIGPFARLREGSQLANHSKIGNFVETKQAVIGEGSKVNHLSYIGNATLGEQVNVGAGTVTCNYDGANKHHTTMGDHVFIGSGSMLVAPVHIGAGATIAAGSTITRDAPAGELTVARARQRSIAHWQRPSKKPKTP